MDTPITATELARNLSEILSRVRFRGESFRVERNGEVVARLTPAPAARTSTIADLLALLDRLPAPDDEFEADLESIRAMQGEVPANPWAS